jgi:hypothetical protein
MGFEPVLFGGRPCDLPDCAASAYPSLSLCPRFSRSVAGWPEEGEVSVAVVSAVGRAIGLDVHLDFCEIAIWEDGKARSAGRVALDLPGFDGESLVVE